jgi:glutaredoxin 3
VISREETVPNIEMYSSDFCPFCSRAKNLLRKKGVEFTEIDVDGDPAMRQQMTERSGGGRTVPQILFDGKPIGGSDELAALEQSGELDRLLQGTA